VSYSVTEMRTFCYACELLLADIGEEASHDPCPRCGNTTHVSYPPGQEFVLTGNLRLYSKPPEGGRWFIDQRETHSLYRKTNERHFVKRTIDRDNDRYYERIIEVGTGRVIRHVDEPLSEHRGRGSAKRNSDKLDEDGT